MKLNLNILQDRLSEHHTVIAHGSFRNTRTLPRPHLATQMSLLPGKFYILSCSDLEHYVPVSDGNTAILAVGLHLPDIWCRSAIPILQISEDIPVSEVFNEVQNIYDTYDGWDQKLLMELGDAFDFDIRRMLLLGSEMLGNPIAVTDHRLQVILQVENNGQRLEVNTESRPVPVEYQEQVKQVCERERMIRTPYLSDLRGTDFQTYCNNLYPAEHFTGCVYVSSSSKPFHKGDFALADHFFSYFQKGFQKHLCSQNQVESPKNQAFQKLLYHQPLTEQEETLFSLEDTNTMVCFLLEPLPDCSAMPKEYMTATLNTLMGKNILAVQYKNGIAGLLQLGADASERLKTTDLFRDLLQRMEYVGCISKDFTRIAEFQEHFLQANYVKEHCLTKDSAPTVHFRNHILQFILDESTHRIPAKSLYPTGLAQMIAYDERKQTAYVKTLDVFLKNEMNYTKTAEELFIHRSSLLKRLDRIRHFIGDDLEDPDKRLYYRICLALHARE